MDKMENVLYYNERRIIDDQRFTVSVFGRNWNLNIVNLDSSDEGVYKCVINTVPLQTNTYWLTVYVPPVIIVENSSPDVEATEGTTVRLACNATGHPEPTISWSYRRANESAEGTNVKRIQQTGPILQIHNVSRYLDEIYTCSASNGFAVADKHDIRVRVRFKPQVKTWQKKVVAAEGESVNLRCEGIGYRQPKMYFAKDNLELRPDGEKHIYTSYATEYSHQLTLTIHNLNEDDFGYYKCVALNSLGRAEKYIELNEAESKSMKQSEPETTDYETFTSTNPTRKLQSLPPELKKIGGKQAVAKKTTSSGSALRCSMHALNILLFCISLSVL